MTVVATYLPLDLFKPMTDIGLKADGKAHFMDKKQVS